MNSICVTETDAIRISLVLESLESSSGRIRGGNEKLKEELKRAKRVPSAAIPPDVVTMNSTVLLRDSHTGEEETLTLCYPADADAEQGRISILAPIGTALLGFREGDVVSWETPGGTIRFEIIEVLYQPEAAGDLTR